MAQRPVKFIWGSSDQVLGEWHAGLWGWYDRRAGSRRRGLVVSVRGLLGWTAGLAVAGYLLGATLLYFTFQRNPYNQVTLADTFLLPVRWQQVREVRGRMLVTEGLDDLKQKRWAEATMKLRAGLARAPHETRARLALAQFYLMANQRPVALKLLTEDLANGYPGRRYMETLCSVAAEGEDFDVILAACDRFPAAPPADQKWLATQKVQALVRAGRAEEALALLEAKGDAADELAKEARVLALLELKRVPDALAFLDRWRQEGRGPQPQIVRLQARAFREAGKPVEMARALEEFRQLAPADARTHAYGIVQRSLAGESAAAEAAVGEFFLRFAGAKEKLMLLANALAEAKAPALVEKCVNEGALHGFPAMPLNFALLQAQLAVGDWAGAARTMAKISAARNRRDPAEAFVVEWMEDVVGVITRADEAPQAGLIEFLQKRPSSMRIYRQTLEPLVLARRFAAAEKVLELAERSYPGSKTLAALRRQVDEGLRPVAVATVAAEPAAGGAMVREKAFFEELEAAQREQRWKDAAQAIREIRVTKPAWLAARDGELLEWQMRAAVHTGDTPELLGAAAFYLDGSVPRANRAVGFAQELGASGNREDAERLLKEVFRKSPDFPPAVRLLKAWHPPKPKAEPKK